MRFSLTKGLMVIKVLKTKNNQLRRGDEVVISELSSFTCPVKLLKRYLYKFQIRPYSRCLIFRPISRGKGSCKLVSPDKPISYKGSFWAGLEKQWGRPFQVRAAFCVR